MTVANSRLIHLRHPIGRCFATALIGAVLLALGSMPAHAGGGPENALLIIDPSNQDSLNIGNYYKTARNIPDRNIIYMNPEPIDYTGFVQFQLDALLGTLTTRALDDHIDYIIIPPGPFYRVHVTPGLIADSCSSVTNFSIASMYSMAHITDDILDGDNSTRRNEYSTFTNTARAFDSNTAWLLGAPSQSSQSRRYFIGCMLGYTGVRGNTIPQITLMIDRGVAVDGTRPAGRFYFIKTTDVPRSSPRDPLFPATVAALQAAGASALQIGDGAMNVVLPIGHQDCLGVMTGIDSMDILGANMTLRSGAFCDHLTSYAGDFATPAQTKMSDWITKGASGTCGTVEEPCNYPGKFPAPNMHVFYYKGLSLGEAVFRSLGFVPYQVLMYGDPLTRPFAYIPSINVTGLPGGAVSGVVTLTPTGGTSAPGALVTLFDLYIDGVRHSTVSAGQSFSIDTAQLADGPHDVRVVGYENTAIATQGRWIGALQVNNFGRSAVVGSLPTSGNLSTLFEVNVSAAGSSAAEIRLLHNNRVLASTSTASQAFTIPGSRLGAGTVRLVAVADFVDGTQAVSDAITLTIASSTTPPSPPAGNTPPIAHSYHTVAVPGVPRLLDLPVTDADGDALSVVSITPPAQGTLTADARAFLLTPDPDAAGVDTVTFRGNDGHVAGNIATVTIDYCSVPTITSQPTDELGCPGQTVMFEVVADGRDLSYQWFHDQAPISGATDSVLTINNLQVADAGSYSVKVTSLCDVIRTTVDSIQVSLTVPSAVTIDTQPVGGLFCAGTGQGWFGFVTVTGATSLQWLKDGQPIPGQTGSFIILPNLMLSDRGEYSLEASNACFAVESDAALVDVVGCGDSNLDGAVDMIDFAGLQNCFTGPDAGPVPDACGFFDFNGDFDIDLFDYAAFRAVITGP